MEKEVEKEILKVEERLMEEINARECLEDELSQVQKIIDEVKSDNMKY